MSTHSFTPLPPRGPDCAAYAPLLPLAGQRLLDARDAARLRDHLTGCVHCQAVLAAYDRLDGALVQHFAQRMPSVDGLTEAIMDHIEDQHNPLPPLPTATTPAPPPTPLRGRRGFITSMGALAAVLAIAVVTAALFAGRVPHGGPGGRVPPLPTTTPVPPVVSQVAMAGPNDGWAFAASSTSACAQQQYDPKTGQAIPNPACQTTFVMVHYDGHVWKVASVADFVVLGSLTMTSATTGWALGNRRTGPQSVDAQTQVIRYSGGRWFVDGNYAFPGDYRDVESLAMISPTEGWAVGRDSHNPNLALLMHYTLGRWARVPLPDDLATATADLRSISMLSAQEGWAVGSAGTDSANPTHGPVLMLHYHNGEWTKEDVVGFPGVLNSVYAVAPDEAFAVGEDSNDGHGLIMHGKAGVWTQIMGIQLGLELPILRAVTMVSPTEGWAVGDGAMFVHYHDGVWSEVGDRVNGYMLREVSMSSASDGWAVGAQFTDDYLSPSPYAHTTLFHYTGGVWTPYATTNMVPSGTAGG